jgi:hypothetical protein
VSEACARIKTTVRSLVFTSHVLKSLWIDPLQNASAAPPQLAAMRMSGERQVEPFLGRAWERLGTVTEKKAECVCRSAIEASVNAARENVGVVS